MINSRMKLRFQQVNFSLILPPSQPTRSPSILWTLADDIAVNGLREPLRLALTEDGRYEIVSGSRRYEALCALREANTVVYRDGEIGLATDLYRTVPAFVSEPVPVVSPFLETTMKILLILFVLFGFAFEAQAQAPKPLPAAPRKAEATPTKKATESLAEQRKRELKVTLEKKKAFAAFKRAKARARNAQEAAEALAAYEREVKLAPYRAAAQAQALQNQYLQNSLRLQSDEDRLMRAETGLINQQRIRNATGGYTAPLVP